APGGACPCGGAATGSPSPTRCSWRGTVCWAAASRWCRTRRCRAYGWCRGRGSGPGASPTSMWTTGPTSRRPPACGTPARRPCCCRPRRNAPARAAATPARTAGWRRAFRRPEETSRHKRNKEQQEQQQGAPHAVRGPWCVRRSGDRAAQSLDVDVLRLVVLGQVDDLPDGAGAGTGRFEAGLGLRLVQRQRLLPDDVGEVLVLHVLQGGVLRAPLGAEEVEPAPGRGAPDGHRRGDHRDRRGHREVSRGLPHGGGGRGRGVDGSGRVCGGGGRAVVLGDRHGLPLRVVLPRILGPAPTGGFRAVVLGGAAPPAETVPLETLAEDAAVGGGRAAKGPGVRPAGRSVGGRVAGPALGPVTRPVAGRAVRLGTGLVVGRS